MHECWPRCGQPESGALRVREVAALGSENAVKEAGKEYLKGKEYVVQDGDILAIRFSV